MIEIPSKVEGLQFDLYKLEQKLKPIGYSIGGNWDYDHGAFDYKISEDSGYQYLRLPFKAIDGQLDARGCTVELGRPFLLSHEYEENIDEQGQSGVFSGTFNQFQEPTDKDANFPNQYIDVGKTLVQELEDLLL
ncbi:YugN-like family protein [Neobacillus sedimentimangrovi]|uniref:YugN-like family protein n=1 Tax=Neobacillus sedimentimangrovi TaxID=2699460 RepID=UPI0013CF896E|nr:YugN-like family protein [Neobacillus sedimentimangrovi]